MKMKTIMAKMNLRRSSQPCKVYCHHKINKPKHCKYKGN